MRTVAMLFAILFLGVVWGQDLGESRSAVFLKTSGKEKALRVGATIRVHMVDTSRTPSVVSYHVVEGSFLQLGADSIKLNLNAEEKGWRRMDQWSGHPLERFSTFYYSMDTMEVPIAVDLGRISHVAYEPRLSSMGTTITVISLAGLLVYAPLRGMRFRDGTFDGERYLRAATPCAIGVGVGLVVMPFTPNERKLKIRIGG